MSERRYEHGSIILTTNRGIASWGEIFEDTTVAAAIRDRLLHHATVLQIDGDSYRMRTHRARIRNLRAGLNAPDQGGEFSRSHLGILAIVDNSATRGQSDSVCVIGPSVSGRWRCCSSAS